MSAARTALLAVLMLLLAIVLVGGQLMILAQESLLKTSFLLPYVERLFSTISTPQTHEEIVSFLVAEALRNSRVGGVPAELRQSLLKASIKAFSPQWIQEEVLAILNKVLAVLRGRSQELEHTIYLSRRKEVLISELAKALPPEYERELRAGSSMLPDSIELTELMGDEVPAALRLFGQRYILFSLLAIYVIPGILVLLGLQVGKVRWGVVGIGAATLVSGRAATLLLALAYPAARDALVSVVASGLPGAFSWLPAFVSDVLAGVRASGRGISIAFAASGGAILAIGVVVVLLTRRKAA
jgi:hypothetical protein